MPTSSVSKRQDFWPSGNIGEGEGGIKGDGGAGGEGGRGGNVTVNTSGLKQEVRVDNFGGAGGRGGAGGAGGTAAIIPQYYRGPIPQNYIVNAPPGRPGADGRPGPQGRIFEK